MLNTILKNLNSPIGNGALACWLASISYGAEGMSDATDVEPILVLCKTLCQLCRLCVCVCVFAIFMQYDWLT